MFAVVKIKENEKRLFKRIKYKIKKPLPELERINVSRDSYFYYLEIFDKQTEDNPNILSELLGPCASRIIFCGENPSGHRMIYETVKTKGYLQRVLLNTALSMLKKRCSEFERLRLCYIDRKGDYTDYLKAFAEYAGYVTVVTNEPEKYEKICHDVFADSGLSVVIRDDVGKTENYELIVSPEFDLNKYFNNTVIIKNSSTGLLDVLKGHDIKLPDNVKALIPPHVNKLDFVYSLYKYCRIDSLGELCFSDFKVIDSIR